MSFRKKISSGYKKVSKAYQKYSKSPIGSAINEYGANYNWNTDLGIGGEDSGYNWGGFEIGGGGGSSQPSHRRRTIRRKQK